MGNDPLLLLLFRVSGKLCALPAGNVQELMFTPWLSRPPGLPSFLEGFLPFGSHPIPVLRLDRLFQLKETSLGRYTSLVLLRGVDYPGALLVD